MFEYLYFESKPFLLLILIVAAAATYMWCLYFGSRTKIGGRSSLSGPMHRYYVIEIPIFILPAVVLTSTGYFHELWFVSNTGVTEYRQGAALALWTLLTFSLSAFIASRLIPEKTINAGVPRIRRDELAYALIAVLAVLLASITVIAKDWPLVSGIIHGDTQIRRHVVSQPSVVPSYFISLTQYSADLAAVHAGFVAASKRKKLGIVSALLVLSFLAASWTGAKGPGVNVVLSFMFSKAFFSGVRFNASLVLRVGLAGGLVALLVYYLVFQDKYGEDVFKYFVIRVFGAQMGGFYEALALDLRNVSYALYGLPFGSRIAEVEPFYRDLMLASEVSTATSGVKNSLFSAEAYGIGGFMLAVLSGSIFGVGVVISARIMCFGISIFVVRSLVPIFIFPLIKFMALTSEFASVVFMRKLLIGAAYSIFIIIFAYVFLMVIPSSTRRRALQAVS